MSFTDTFAVNTEKARTANPKKFSMVLDALSISKATLTNTMVNASQMKNKKPFILREWPIVITLLRLWLLRLFGCQHLHSLHLDGHILALHVVVVSVLALAYAPLDE